MYNAIIATALACSEVIVRIDRQYETIEKATIDTVNKSCLFNCVLLALPSSTYLIYSLIHRKITIERNSNQSISKQ